MPETVIQPAAPASLPEPVFPQHPQLLNDPPAFLEQPHVPPAHRYWGAPLVYRTMSGSIE